MSDRRSTRFKLPERAQRTADGAYLDHILSGAEKSNTSSPSSDEPADPQTSSVTPLPATNPLLTVVKSPPATEATPVQKPVKSLNPNSKVRLRSPNIATPLIETTPPPVPLNRSADSAKKAENVAPADSPAPPAFLEFEKRWKVVLGPKHLKVCELLFSNTVSIGLSEYITSVAQIHKAVGTNRRYCFTVLNYLETIGFIKRSNVYDGNKLIGIKIQFFLEPIDPHL